MVLTCQSHAYDIDLVLLYLLQSPTNLLVVLQPNPATKYRGVRFSILVNPKMCILGIYSIEKVRYVFSLLW